MAEQKEEEKRREHQINLLFSQDAEDFWKRQDIIWEKEKIARERLMNDIVDSWKSQIEDKINGTRVMRLNNLYLSSI